MSVRSDAGEKKAQSTQSLRDHRDVNFTQQEKAAAPTDAGTLDQACVQKIHQGSGLKGLRWTQKLLAHVIGSSSQDGLEAPMVE